MRFSEPKLVKLLVRRVGSNNFLRTTGRWTKRAEGAMHFPNLLNAIHACIAKGLHTAELILRYDGDNEDRRYVVALS
jgi:hypothetical protein